MIYIENTEIYKIFMNLHTKEDKMHCVVNSVFIHAVIIVHTKKEP